MPPRFLSFLPVLALAVLLSGCFYSREMAQTRRDIERSYPDLEFDHGMVVSLGPATLRLVGWITSLVPDEEAEMVYDYLSQIRRVKVGYYPTTYGARIDGVDLPALRRFERDDWEVAVRVREDDEVVWVLYRSDQEVIRDLYVLVLTGEELVMARLNGRLDELFARIMEDHLDFRTMWSGGGRAG